jgi:anaerobic selenocysteine-containing dehydrogenase
MSQVETKTVHRSCTLCEAHCGLTIDVEDNRVVRVRGDEDDVLSAGYICPKGVAIGELHHDPDRLRTPMVRNAAGELEPASWEDALDRAAEGLAATSRTHGRNSVGCYIGNPIIHNTGAILLRQSLISALGTRNCYSAGSQDTSPRFATSYHLYGSSFAIPVPDIDRTDYFFCLGANPIISNGSAMTAPNMRGRIRSLQERGGKIVVVDPRRTETADIADEHVAIRPGTDAALLLGMAGYLVAEGRADRSAIAEVADGWANVERALSGIDLDAVAASTGIERATIERLALEFADAKTSVAYSRVGICNSRHGTLATYATDLLNLVAGRLGRTGGAMFTTPAIDSTRLTRLPGMDGHGRWTSRVRGLPETLGDLPAATLADEMETPGEGQIRALVTFAGNPVLSAPNGRRIDKAVGKLDFMVSIDLYVNETTRHADVILPPAWCLADQHVDVFFGQFSVRNTTGWSPPVVERGQDERADWQILLGLIERLGGGPTGMKPLDTVLKFAKRFGYRWTPYSSIDLMLRTGTYGDKFLPGSKGLSLAKLAKHPHGVDLGPLEPGVARRILHRDKRVHIDAGLFVNAIGTLAEELQSSGTARTDGLVLIGRRELRTNNSWMHNVASLMRGRERCVLYVHPDDATRLGLVDGSPAMLSSRVFAGEIPVRITDEVTPGVVCMPHGWGHSASAPWQRVAGERPGVSMNDWSDDDEVEALVGQSILNGISVELAAVEKRESAVS